ncbi:MAG: purine-nucleoside phosphorylase [Hyphomicrobiales bacterium]|nr:MAG: purine-nucleoside phosphorylase [Hyphomicrobiales bacterium]
MIPPIAEARDAGRVAADAVRARAGDRYAIGIVLGSGLGALADAVEDAVRIPYGDIPGYPRSGVTSHAGMLVAGRLGGKRVIVLAGRSHTYEHGNPAAMAVPMAMLAALGCSAVFLTNAAGSLKDDMPPGSLMAIADHINLTGLNPLVGAEGDSRFVDMSSAYDPGLRKTLSAAAQHLDTGLSHGTYMWFPGPSFETPAEIRAARVLGADAVGMSTVPEAVLARYFGLRVVGLSTITNFAAGMTGTALSHEETKTVGGANADKVCRLIPAFLEEFDHDG